MREEILAALAAQEEKVTVGGKQLTVRELGSAADGAPFLDKTDVAYKLLTRCVFGDDDQPVFTDDDIPALKAGGKRKLMPLVNAVLRVNGLAAEEAEKNSEADQSSG